jgi:hypothetical protein
MEKSTQSLKCICVPNGLRYRLVGRNGLGNGALLKLIHSPKKRAESQMSGARFKAISLIMLTQPYQLSLPFSSYPSRLSRKNLIALFMKEQHVQTYGDGESA